MKFCFWAYFLLILFNIMPFTVYANCISGDCIRGKGTYLFKDGSKYSGSFYKSRPHGKGTFYHKDGNTYIGDYVNGVKQGQGKLIFKTKDVYEGSFNQGLISGVGKMMYRNGDVYVGEWSNGKSSGSGKYTFADQDVYEGNFFDGYFSGYGKLMRKDGSYYEGEWMKNKKNGRGISWIKQKKVIQYYEMNVLVREEAWLDETVIHQNNSHESTDNKIAKDCRKSHCHLEIGTYRYGDGSLYTGSFLNGEGEGNGKCEYSNGDVYEGGWKNHGPHGIGSMRFKSGKTYEAIWENGIPKQKITPEKTVAQQSSKNEGQSSIPQTKAEKVHIYALIVGVASYNHMPSLKYTDDDAYQLYAFLKSPEGGAIPDDQIKILIDDAATYQSVVTALKNLSRRADHNDVVLLYLAGHGLDGAYVPSDFDGRKNQIPYSDILDLLNQSSAKHKLFIADACHSGSISMAARTPISVSLENFYSAYNTLNGGTAIMMSSKKEEVSLEYGGGLRQGIFSHYLIKGLKGEADQNQDKIISITELYDYVASSVRTYTAKAQNPVLIGDYDKEMPVGMVR